VLEGVDFPFLFSRFCHFYSLTPDYVLAMPARMFFVMERQIVRIMAEVDLRSLAVGTSTMSGEAAQRIHQVLIAEQGEVYVVARSSLVAGEEGAIDKLKALF